MLAFIFTELWTVVLLEGVINITHGGENSDRRPYACGSRQQSCTNFSCCARVFGVPIEASRPQIRRNVPKSIAVFRHDPIISAVRQPDFMGL
jgi:hypothetical protein